MGPKVYLAGWVGETKYRDYCLKFSKQVNLLDPMIDNEEIVFGKDYKIAYKDPSEFTENQIEQIVTLDKNLIEKCDVLVAYITRFSVGTIMEVMHAWNLEIPVYIINPGLIFQYDVWLKYHSTKIFETIDECFESIISEF